MAYLGTGWCGANPRTGSLNLTNGSHITEQSYGNFYNDSMGQTASGYEQWNYDGTRVYKQVSDMMAASYPNWLPGTLYGTGASNIAVRPTFGNPGGYTFVAYVSGASGGGTPTWTLTMQGA
jgi:hypothetical protein